MIPDSPDDRRGAAVAALDDADSLEVKTAAGSVKARSRDLLTLLAAMIAGVVIAGAYMLYTHVQDTRAISAELVTALKDLTVNIREQNCLIATKGEQDLCRRISR